MRIGLLALCLVAGSPATRAASEPAPDPIAEAKQRGFQPRPSDEPPGSLLGGLVASVPGFLLHGVGHYYTGDESAALKLFAAELIGAGLVASALILEGTSGDSGELGAPRRLLLHSGLVLFVGSWAADILGSFKGAQSFEPDSSRIRGTTFGLAYRYTNDPLTPFRHHSVLRLRLDTGLLYIEPRGDLEVHSPIRFQRYELDVGLRPLRGENPHNALALGTLLRRDVVDEFGYATRAAEIYAHTKLDLGLFLRSLHSFYVVNRVGVGFEQLQISTATGRTPPVGQAPDFSTEYLFVESGAELNVGREWHLSVLYVQNPTRDIAPSSEEAGIFDLRVLHRYDDETDIELKGVAGQGWALWLGVALQL